jgi:preprotein translocase subunit SecE
VEEVLLAVQQAPAASGIEVAVGSDTLARGEPGKVARVMAFLRDVQTEILKVTWPTWPELKKATTIIIIFVFVLGLAIGWFDVVLQYLLVKLVARLF